MNRYWVGGAGNWSDTANHWSASSGGAPGASLPTSADDVHIDGSSGFGAGGQISLDGAYYSALCRDLTFETGGHAVTIAYVSSDITIYGSLTIEASTIWDSGTWLYCLGAGSHTIQTSGVQIAEVFIGTDDNGNYSSGTYTLSGNLTLGTSDDLHISGGTFDANDFNVTAQNYYLYSSGASITVTMGSGTWESTKGYFEVWEPSNTVTINSETSTVKLSDSAGGNEFYGGGKTWYNLWIAGSATQYGYIYAANTFNEVKVGPAGLNLIFEGVTQTMARFLCNGDSTNDISLDVAPSSADSYGGGINNDWWFYIGDINKGGQAFTGDGKTLDSVRFQLAKNGTPTGNIVIEIYAETHATAYGTDSVPTGSVLATSDPIDIATLTTSRVIYDFVFSGANRIVLTNGTKYFAVVSYGNATWPNYLRVAWDNTSPAHAGNAAYYIASWTSQNDRDLWFIVDTVGQFTISKPSGRVVCNYLDIKNSIASGGAQFYAGSKSTNSVGDYVNTGWQFKDPPHDLSTMGVGG